MSIQTSTRASTRGVSSLRLALSLLVPLVLLVATMGANCNPAVPVCGNLGGTCLPGQQASCFKCVTPGAVGDACSNNPCDSNGLCATGLVCLPNVSDVGPLNTCQKNYGTSSLGAPCAIAPNPDLCDPGLYCRPTVENNCSKDTSLGDRCATTVALGGSCDSTYDSPGCAACEPGTICSDTPGTFGGRRCLKACSDKSDCPCQGKDSSQVTCNPISAVFNVNGTFCGDLVGIGQGCNAYDQCDPADPNLDCGFSTSGSTTCCHNAGFSCNFQQDCCSTSYCDGTTCKSCQKENQACTQTSECCGQKGLACQAGLCVVPCLPVNTPGCKADTDCCGHDLQGTAKNHCALPVIISVGVQNQCKSCSAHDGACSTDADCCAEAGLQCNQGAEGGFCKFKPVCVPGVECTVTMPAGLKGACAKSKTTCPSMNGPAGCVQTTKPKPETCDGNDDNCDGIINNIDPNGCPQVVPSGCPTNVLINATRQCVGSTAQCLPDPTIKVCHGCDGSDVCGVCGVCVIPADQGGGTHPCARGYACDVKGTGTCVIDFPACSLDSQNCYLPSQKGAPCP